MKFCTSCGQKMENNSPFCKACGAKMETKKPVQTRTASTASTMPSLASLSKKTKILIGSALLVLILCVSLYKVGEAYTDKAKLMENFEEQLEKGNTDELLALLSSKDDSGKITKKNVEALVGFLKEYPDAKETLVAQLKDSAKAYDETAVTASADTGETQQLVTLEKRGKKFLIYDHYELVLQPFPMTIYTNYDDLTFYVDGKKVKPEASEGDIVNLGSFIPGDYKVKAVLKSDFVELEKKAEINHVGPTDTDLLFDIDYVRVNTNVADSSVFVNGKDTGMKVDKEKSIEIGPVLTDGSMTVQLKKDMPFGKIESEDAPIDSNQLTLGLTLADKDKEKVKEGLKRHFLNLSKALANQDAKSLAEDSNDVSEFVTDSFEDMTGDDWKTFGYVSSIEVDTDALYLEDIEGKWFATLPVRTKWMEDSVYSGDPVSLSEQSSEDSYSLSFQNDKWSVESWGYIWSFEEDNAEEIKVDSEALKKQLESSSAFTNIKAEQSTDEVESFVESYISASVEAINERDYSIVSGDIDSSSEYTTTVSDYIDYLDKKGITEDLVNIDVEKVETLDEGSYHVYTFEEYNIYYDDGTSKYKSFDGKYKVTSTSSGLKMYDLVSTEEVESKDL
ncbi:zinc ribbon domain-containing protein [Lysinibacillus sphaericus]